MPNNYSSLSQASQATGPLETSSTQQSTSPAAAGQSISSASANTSTNSLSGYFSSSISSSLVNPLETRSSGERAISGILHPQSFKDLKKFTSLPNVDTGDVSTLSISNREYYKDDCENIPTTTRPIFALEKHITVIRKGPTMPLQLEMYPYEDATLPDDQMLIDRADISNLNYGDYIGDDALINSSFTGNRIAQSSNYAEYDELTGQYTTASNPTNFTVGLYWLDPDGSYDTNGTASDNQDISLFYKPSKELVQNGDFVYIPIDVGNTGEDWQKGDNIVIEHEYLDSLGDNQKATARLEIDNISYSLFDETTNKGWGFFPCGPFIDPSPTWASPLGDIYAPCAPDDYIQAKIISITGNFPLKAVKNTDLYNVYLVQKPPIFELKFPKFSYRYKYEDGEYSVFAPWSEIAFVPGQFDYLPKKGYNLGMKNNLRKLNVKNWVPKNIPKDVIQVDILYKESNSPNVYTVSSHKKDDKADYDQTESYWEMTGDGGHNGFYTIKSELIHKVVQSNQMLRPWDNVPRKALAQEVTANRLIFANYVQNFDLKSWDASVGIKNEVKPSFTTAVKSSDYSWNSKMPMPGYPAKSLKSMRTYQVGVVYRGRYGRETPVLTSKSGSIKIPKSSAKLQNRLNVQLNNDPPYWAESFTFYIKETSNEYYNLAMDRWYDADDGGVWLSFPSSERNKITDNTNLILKKQHDSDIFTDFETKYKVLSIKNDAPTFIKTENKFWGSLPMMLPPPGWGQLGNWDSGMFYNTGLPLPNRMYLDIFAEYWDQSPLNQLTSMNNAQVRIVQSAGAASAYRAATSDTTNKTRWYDISNISYIGSPPQTEEVSVEDNGVITTNQVELPGQQEQLVRISLEKAFGNDALFCEPSDNLSLARGLSLEARTKVVRDKSQFEGRFFVKVLRDGNIETNIVQPQSKTEDKYQVLFSRKIKYICAAHPGLQDWSHKAIFSNKTAGSVGGQNSWTTDSGTGISQFDGWVNNLDRFVTMSNFIPIGINHQKDEPDSLGNDTGNPFLRGTESGVNQTLYEVDNGQRQTRIVSSLSKYHAGKGANYNSVGGAPLEKPSGTSSPSYERNMWPYGPGYASVGAFDSNGWGIYPDHADHLRQGQNNVNKLIWPNYRVSGYGFVNDSLIGENSIGTPVVDGTSITMNNFTSQLHNSKGKISDWPSFGPQVYNPYLSYSTDSDGNSIDETGGGSTKTWAVDGAAAMVGPYMDRMVGAPYIDRKSMLKVKLCPGLDTGGHIPILPSTTTNGLSSSPDASAFGEHNYLQGANPYNIPAIWGDQTDFLRASPIYDNGTLLKLRKDWWHLYYGRDEVSSSWPLGKFSPNRWFIDKCGAAQGHSGNGVWDDGVVGYIDISFYGVGKDNELGLRSRKQSFRDAMLESNSNEMGFADAISTPGTQFRFTHDPDGIVYTVTGAQEAEVYNYEAPQGHWGVEDDTGVIVGGDGIGYGSPAPSRGTKESGPLAGGVAFISDLFSSETSMMGSHPTNKRIRWTLTLDKIIGEQGDHKFHPITNHVEPVDVDAATVYKSNIEIGRAKYQTTLRSNHITDEDGGTPEFVEYYNLASYFNTTRNTSNPQPWDIYGFGDSSSVPDANLIQPDIIDYTDPNNFYARNPNAYIGLHERGLNQTEIEIVTTYKGEDRDRPISNNPAIWETEPMEDVGLDIYYAASPTYPIRLDRYRDDHEIAEGNEDSHGANWYDYSDRGEEVIKVGSTVSIVSGNSSTSTPTICSVQNDVIWLTPTVASGAAFNIRTDPGGDKNPLFGSETLTQGTVIRITWRGEGTFYGVGNDQEWMDFEILEAISFTSYRIKPLIHGNPVQLGYYNCWSFGTGVESNRVRDDYNAITIDKGVKASMPLATTYEEERRSNGLIFSGIYNSTSGVNRTNQFIQAEPITKDLNPINGSIQKLFARDTDLVTFCENKVFKIFAKKDALFNADGNTNVTSNAMVLGQAMPFSGEYGISQNPESFASESYRVYFADKDRGAVLRLSRDGLTPISDAGMKDWFRDNLRFANSLIGSYDNRNDQYNLTIETRDQNDLEKEYTISYTEKRRGWESFKSFITQGGISHKNIYYSFPSNKLRNYEDPWGIHHNSTIANATILPSANGTYSTELSGVTPHLLTSTTAKGEMFQHSLDLAVKTVIEDTNSIASTITIGLNKRCIPGMYVECEGIPIDIVVSRVVHNTTTSVTVLHLSQPINIDSIAFIDGVSITSGSTFLPVIITSPRNSFYHNHGNYSMITTLFNGDKGTVKRFKTLDYEGTQAKTIQNTINQYNLSADIDTINNTTTSVGQIYYDNYPKLGWYTETIKTDMQDGKVPEFIDKENKWFNSIQGFDYDSSKIDDGETAEFSLQGLGKINSVIISPTSSVKRQSSQSASSVQRQSNQNRSSSSNTRSSQLPPTPSAGTSSTY